MIKYFCDRCGKETKHGIKCIRDGNDLIHMCYDCHSLLVSIKDKIDIYKTSDVEKFCNMTDEDIELLRYTFKVGDKVITDDGRTGTITRICDCDRCKNRGFYEPEVDFGDYTDYIMISDKEDGFKSYYQIGDRVFGNLDEKPVIKELEEIGERYNKLIKQQGMIHLLRYKKEYNNGN